MTQTPAFSAVDNGTPRVARKSPALAPKGTTADRVVSVLVEHIRRHRLPAGALLPSELETSSQLNVSRSVVREAYRSLSSAGLVEVANGRSPRVGQITNRSLIQLVQHALSTRQASAAQILELRGPIEEHAAELAARHRTQLDIHELRQAVTAMRAAESRTDSYVKADLRFHEVIGRATGQSDVQRRRERAAVLDGRIDPCQPGGTPVACGTEARRSAHTRGSWTPSRADVRVKPAG